MHRLTTCGMVPLMFACVASALAAQDQGKDEKAKADAKAVLEKLVGKWDTTCELAPAVWTPEAMNLKGVTSGVLVLHGKAVHLSGDFLPGKKRFTLTLVYDEAAQVFEALYDGGGKPVSLYGTWNPDAKTLSFQTGDLAPTSLNKITLRLADADTWDVHVDLRNRTFGKYLLLNAKATRQR